MSRLSVKPVIYKKGKKKTETASIAIRVTYQGKHRYKETSYRALIENFNDETGEVSRQEPNHALANSTIKRDVGKITRDLLILKDEPGFNIGMIERYLQPGNGLFKNSFTAFVKKYAEQELRSKGKADGTVKNYYKQLNKLQEFAGRENISFSEIDPEFLRRYKTWLVEVKENDPNTIWDSMTKFIKKFFHEARVQIPDYKFPRPVEGGHVYLTMEELDAIENILPELPPREYTDAIYFLLECYSGIRHGDWKRFGVEKLVSGDSFKVIAKKNKQPIYLSLKNRPRLKAILKKIEGTPYTSGNEQTNRNLKVIAAKAGIKKSISTHTGRHTCGTMHAELGFSKEYVCELLAVGMKTVEGYYKVTRQKLRREDERLKGL